jgi:hypothetical protein
VTSDVPEVPKVPEKPASSSEGGRSRATSMEERAQMPIPRHVSWRSVGAGVASIGTPIGVAMLHPLLGEVMAVIEFVVLLLIVPGTALFGSQILSERAFRLLRWLGNRPEPPGPSDQGRARVADRQRR